MKKIDTYFTVNENIKEHELYIAIDLLRATSVITTMFAGGCDKILVNETVEETLACKDKGYILTGERKSLKVEGFDFGNSPLELINYYSEGDLKKFNSDKPMRGKSVALTTTNGARAIKTGNSLGDLVVLSSLNFEAVYNFIKKYDNIGIICAGLYDRISLEDSFIAGKLVELLVKNEGYHYNDGSYIAMSLAGKKKEDIIENAVHAQKLLELNFNKDIEFCFSENLFDVVPFAKKGENILKI